MKLHSLVMSAALCGTFGSAMAETFDIGLVGGPYTWSTHEVGNRHGAGDFSDTYTFSDYTAATSIVDGTLTSTATNLGQLVFTSATLNGVALDVTFYPMFGRSIISLDSVNVTGPLTLVINGTVKAVPGVAAFASYGGDFNVASPVSEPATYGMLLGGMSVLAFAARRRAR